jgi:hypothetical protein
MTSVTHSFLINVAQRQAHSIPAGQSTKLELKLFANHPSSSLIWFARPLNWATEAGRRRYSVGYKDRYDFSSQKVSSVSDILPFGDAVDPLETASLSLNGHQRWPVDMPAVYFRTSVPHTAWRTMPSTHIYSYCFALEAATWQPTSTLNFSRLDHVSLGLTFATGIQASEFFTINESYNLLLIKDGKSQCRQEQAMVPRGTLKMMKRHHVVNPASRSCGRSSFSKTRWSHEGTWMTIHTAVCF